MFSYRLLLLSLSLVFKSLAVSLSHCLFFWCSKVVGIEKKKKVKQVFFFKKWRVLLSGWLAARCFGFWLSAVPVLFFSRARAIKLLLLPDDIESDKYTQF